VNGNRLGRILAIDVRADRIGYAAFETPRQLLDYGTSRFNSGNTGRARAEFLLRALTPSLLVLRRSRTQSTRRRPRWTVNRRIIEGEAKRLGVPVACVTERALKKLFTGFQCRNKFQVATLLGTWFPEIARNVPRARKCYEPEPWPMAYFDAIALGVAYVVLTGPASYFTSNDGVFSSASE
jgi:hypothetical protein